MTANRISPNRRRSIAVLGPAGSQEGRNRRRAYSIVPGEKLSPAAKHRRNLAPRKSILKGSNGQEDNDDEDATHSMEFTQVQRAAPRKSLGRRVSFASHAHVRIFEKAKKTDSPSANPPDPQPQAQGDRRENDENAQPDPAHGRRRSSARRRSSTVFSEYGEQSMDMDMDDDAPAPDDFMKGDTIFQQDGSALEDDEFTEDEDGDEDMEVTEAIRLNLNRKRSLSLGSGHPSLALRRRSSIAQPATATQTQHQSENQVPRSRPSNAFSHPQDQTIGEEEEEEEAEQSMDNDVTTSSAQSHATESSNENTAPMEFTIPISRSLRPPPDRGDIWNQLAAMTHPGTATEPDDSDDEAGLFERPVGGEEMGGNTADMDLTAATQRLLRARSSIGLPPITEGNTDTGFGDESFENVDAQANEFQEDSFTSTEDSFADDRAMGDRTLNVTALMRQSLGSMMDSSIEDVTGEPGNTQDRDEVVRVPVGALSEPTAEPPEPPAPAPGPGPDPSHTPTSDPAPAPAPSAPAEQTSHSAPTVYGAPESVRSSVFSAAKPAAPPPCSLDKVPPSATIPKPFTFSVPRSSSPAKTTAPSAIPRPVFSQSPARPRSGTAAFASPTPRKTPLKRPAPPTADDAQHKPSPAKRAAVGRLEPAKVAIFEQPQSQTRAQAQPSANRRTSAVRRPSGYFAQRKSMGAGVFPSTVVSHTPDAPSELAAGPQKAVGQGLGRARASVGAAPSGDGLGIGANRSRPDSTDSAPLYPDVAEIVRNDPPTPSRTNSPSCEREARRQAVAVPTPSRGSPLPASPHPMSPASVFAPPPRRSSATASPKSSPATTSFAPRTGIISNLQPKDEEVDVTQSAPLPSAVTEEWRDGVEDDAGFEDEGPPISIEQFFAMTGIRFMDELTMPKPRQSIVPPMQLRSRPRRRSSVEFSTEEDEDPIPLSEFSIAMAVEVPQLEMYTAVVNDLTAWIENSKKICLEAERETEKVTPELFREFAMVDESEKAMLVHQLKLIKANNYGTAKSQWYDWKMTWVNRLYDRAEQEFVHLESDAQVLAEIIKEAQDILPALRDEYAQVMAELEQEQADIAEIENSDQNFLNELKHTIAEQQSELEVFRTDVSEGKAKLDRLEEKLVDIGLQKRETSEAIAEAQRFVHIRQEGTSSEVHRLEEELEALQELHLWRVTKISTALVEFEYAHRYHVSIPCVKFRPTLVKVKVSRAKGARTKERDEFPRFTDLALQVAQQLAFDAPADTNIREIIGLLGDFWSSCAQLRAQMTFLAIKYPLSVEAVQSENAGLPDLRVRATVLFPGGKGKAYISFILDSMTYTRWPVSIGSLKASVEVAYGQVHQETALNAVLGRLAQASPADSHGCLLDACIEATEQFV